MRTQTELGVALTQAREQTDDLFRLIRSDSLYERPIPERHRIVFYLGHLEAFDWNLIGRYTLNARSFHPDFDRLFAFGIDPPPGQLPNDQPADWPSLAEVERYNLRTRDEIDELINDVPEQLCHVAIEHRLMHAETLAYIMHSLEYERKSGPVWHHRTADSESPFEHRMIEIPEGAARLGRNPEEGFGWDNEFCAHSVEVPGFSVSKYKVTNGDYLKFMAATGAPAPFFWVRRESGWFCRGMFSEIPLPLDCPVYATHDEASAYAKWRGAKLPTEAQFHRAAGDPPATGNFGFRAWDPVPVDASENGAVDQPQQLYGNGWEWTSTPFAPFPGFEPFPFYQNYSEPFFDGQHFVLKGASPRTAGCFVRQSFRNWFRPAYPYLYGTFRLVE